MPGTLEGLHQSVLDGQGVRLTGLSRDFVRKCVADLEIVFQQTLLPVAAARR